MFEVTRRMLGTVLMAMLATALLLPTSSREAMAQEATVAGDWSGVLSLPDGGEVELIFRVAEDEEGALSTTLDVPAQGAAGIACTETSVDGAELHVSGCEIPGGGGYDGTMGEEGALSGNFNQAGMEFPLDLTPVADSE